MIAPSGEADISREWTIYYERFKRTWRVEIAVPPHHGPDYAPRFTPTRRRAEEIRAELSAELRRRRATIADPSSKNSRKRAAREAAMAASRPREWRQLALGLAS